MVVALPPEGGTGVFFAVVVVAGVVVVVDVVVGLATRKEIIAIS